MVSSAGSSKRKAVMPEPPTSAAKRPRNHKPSNPSRQIIVIDDSDEEDDELNDILAQIKGQEDSVRLASQLQQGDHEIIDLSIEDDALLAQRLAAEWAKEDERQSAPLSARTSYPSSGSSSNTLIGKYPSINGKEKSSTSSYPTPDEVLATYRTIFTRTRKCSSCNGDVKSSRGSVMFSTTSLPPSLLHLLHAPCNSCKINHCRGCFNSIACPPNCKGPSKNKQCPVLTCCAEVRAIAIFETLGGFDRQFIAERAQADSRASTMVMSNMAMSNTQFKSITVGPGGTGYGTDQVSNFAHYPQSNMSNSKPKAKPNTTLESKSAKSTNADDNILRVLELLVQLLPSPYDENPEVYDLLPHASIGHLLSLSQLPTWLTTLLRNDSVTDWIARKELYNAMLSLLRRMASCELSIQCLIEKRLEMATTCGLEQWMWEDGEITWKTANSGELETLPALYTYFKKLTTQSEAFLTGATQMLGDAVDDEIDETIVQGTSLCGDIIAARDDLERAIAVLGRPSVTVDRDNRADQVESTTHSREMRGGKARDLSALIYKAYEEACEKLCFKYVSLAEGATASGEGLHYANFKYAPHLTQSQNSTRNPKGRLHLLKELAVTATSLPPGVWVRIDEVRNDAIKIMIAGPEGTPYAGGLFEFDCCIPLEYPNSPPLMHLRTTGGGSVRFNPNLYNCGKVCLSLLGTWPGRPEEQWSPKSTLLQVLVSIQSMILIDAPYYNEPGHGQADVTSAVSTAYNHNISSKTMEWAIVDWLQDKHCNDIWRDVIKSHFIIRHEKIRQQIVEWIKAPAPSTPTYDPDNDLFHQPTGCASKGAELLANFDKGIERIRSWKSDGDEEN